MRSRDEYRNDALILSSQGVQTTLYSYGRVAVSDAEDALRELVRLGTRADLCRWPWFGWLWERPRRSPQPHRTEAIGSQNPSCMA